MYQQHRQDFFQCYFSSQSCDLGHTGKGFEQYKKPFLSKQAQLQYKFLISLEGNDVASNFKWALSSNSLVLATKHKCESWFMEAQLKPNEHFVLIDETNLEEVVEYYSLHTKQALEIIQNAHNYLSQFLDEKKEFYIGILVLAKYFYYSSQIDLPKFIVELFEEIS
ncbi:glycosyl transferase family 90 [Campylobacter sp. MIT 21-1684]|uniref:glycosyl transferase family 90 n=1 Tax=Campylobacter sp. MIT 21-1684 TaxID=2994322 RepID=UPI00224ACB75|nr:glycosyl transferase family 90 [Campylobacter sp. MIT 21-1684]MCX2682268.1 glycosyl transferase family 90 [Campylobacter sp. MIT 21-1684]